MFLILIMYWESYLETCLCANHEGRYYYGDKIIGFHFLLSKFFSRNTQPTQLQEFQI